MSSIMDVNKILYISQEIAPYVRETPLSVLSRDLPQSIQETGVEVRTFMPRYGAINERRNQLHEVIRLSGLNIVIAEADHPLVIKVATLQPSRMQVYFIDNDDYFQRHMSEGLETDVMPETNDERLIFFARGVIETAKKLRWLPSIIHATGWITALAPLYLRKVYADDPTFATTKIVYSLFGNSYPEALNPAFVDKLRQEGFSEEDLAALIQSPTDYRTLDKIAIDSADAVIIGSDDVDPQLIDYAVKSGKPVLQYPGNDDYATACLNFYNSL